MITRWLVFSVLVLPLQADDWVRYIPTEAPRTWVLADQQEVFREFALSGPGQVYLDRLRPDFDRLWLDWEMPSQPPTYGDPDPRKRTPEKVEQWRAAQDLCNQIATVAETATLLWRLTGEDRYLEKAQAFVLGICAWDQDGVSDIAYNDEAHFRLWRKFPAIFDQLRDTFSPAERALILESFRERGKRSVTWIRDRGVQDLRINSIEPTPRSHPVRFMAMTGVSGLALWDDLPEAREWYAFAYTFFRDSFPPWGGDDGGWAEGVAYWRGVYEHAVFQDALLQIGDPLAYGTDFWKKTGYFQLYFVQPHPTTQFGDMSNAGKFGMEPGVKHFLTHLSRVLQDGYLASYVALYEDPRPLPAEKGLEIIWRDYPSTPEYLIREFIGSRFPAPAPRRLSELPAARHFADIGWVSFRTALGDPANDIQLSFKSSPYGSYSHSHADQNAFILNAYGAELAINSGYREFHGSAHHRYYTRTTASKNAVLVNLRGQDVQSKAATGEILGFSLAPDHAWTAGEARAAYQLLQPQLELETVRRDVVMLERRFFLIRDHLRGDDPLMASWLLHAERPVSHNADTGKVLLTQSGVILAVQLAAVDNAFRMRSWSGFEVAVDSAYVDPEGVAERSWLMAPNIDQHHFRADLVEHAPEATIFALLYPTKNVNALTDLHLEVESASSVVISAPSGTQWRVEFAADGVAVKALP